MGTFYHPYGLGMFYSRVFDFDSDIFIISVMMLDVNAVPLSVMIDFGT